MNVDQIFDKARTSHDAGKFGEAIKLYQMVLMKKPKDLDANYLLGTVYAETGKFDQAERYLLKAEKIMPDSPYIKVNLGNVYKEKGDFESAVICFLNAMQLEQNLPEAHQNFAIVTGMMVEKSEKAAVACLEYALVCIQDGRRDDARTILIAGNTLDPANVHIRYLLAILEGREPDKELQDEFDRLETD